jgi:protein phosphatase
MSPCSTSTIPDRLEHPLGAFADYRAQGVTDLVCQEKHMGSRAVVLVCRDMATARTRFGGSEGETGVVHTRTGRPFLNRALTEVLLDRLRLALSAAGVWEELDASFVLLDAELLPWSLKAGDLLRNQYAAVGAAARSALPAAVDGLTDAARSGVDVAGLLDRTTARARNADAFTAAYRYYVWPTDGIEGIQLAPFQVLASDGATYETRDHSWHLAVADRLVAADQTLVRSTRRVRVDTSDDAAVAEAVRWWDALTAAGGEGMVVKPHANLTRTSKGLAQPGVKVRGREYLRIIYGPDYTEAANLERLRQRNLGHKRSMALREYALGLEALARAAGHEPLWRVHEAVFAVLAMESEPVDPRL